MIARDRLYLTHDRSRIVREGDKEAAFLLVSAGGEIADDLARKYGLLGDNSEAPKPTPPIGQTRETRVVIPEKREEAHVPTKAKKK